MWYYQQGTERKGPVDEATIRSLISGGVISIDTLVWTEGMPSWAALQQTSLAAGMPVPPPSPAAFQAAVNANAKDRVAYVLLAVLLGCGIHNFYAGYNTKGIIQLLVSILTCGLGWIFMWIWAIIEACTVTKDANGVAFK
ncbi:MAG: GYF domain-containing protein [Verrucomicrobiota bacterium]